MPEGDHAWEGSGRPPSPVGAGCCPPDGVFWSWGLGEEAFYGSGASTCIPLGCPALRSHGGCKGTGPECVGSPAYLCCEPGWKEASGEEL